MWIFKRQRQPSAVQLRRLIEKQIFAVSEPEQTDQPEPIVEDLPVQSIAEVREELLPRASQAAFEPFDETPDVAEPGEDEAMTEAKYLRLFEQFQEDIKLIRREQEYLLNVTESSQAFLETLSRELLSVLQLLGQNEEEMKQ